MDDFFTDEQWSEDWDEGEDMIPTDPLEQLNKREQDLFFRMVDLVPDNQREKAIIYFMDHPAKIRAVVDNIKQKRELITNGDKEGLADLLKSEGVDFSKVEELELF
ncbi:MAG: hypothetical protein CO132_06330 [Candidatus Kerfeldbacteria bacterium CG_4_9_14_3_um_filter_45_8]|nr:MAG: hypothetical protein CO132_06330 [Candidatus Kerfeldbacteria bacterium CG_4_9_14_3_um_filter_45_8]